MKAASGASTQYQLAVLELSGLDRILCELQRFEPSEGDAEHINAIRGMALACHLPLRDFLIKLEKYEASLSPFSARGALRTAPRKTQFVVWMDGEVEKLRTYVTGKNLSIALLLQVYAQ